GADEENQPSTSTIAASNNVSQSAGVGRGRGIVSFRGGGGSGSSNPPCDYFAPACSRAAVYSSLLRWVLITCKKVLPSGPIAFRSFPASTNRRTKVSKFSPRMPR